MQISTKFQYTTILKNIHLKTAFNSYIACLLYIFNIFESVKEFKKKEIKLYTYCQMNVRTYVHKLTRNKCVCNILKGWVVKSTQQNV